MSGTEVVLSRSNLAGIKSMFNRMDTNHDGQLNLAEIRAFFERMAGGHADLAEEYFRDDMACARRGVDDSLDWKQAAGVIVDAAVWGTMVLHHIQKERAGQGASRK